MDAHDEADFGHPKTPIVAILQHDEAIADLIAEALESDGCDLVHAIAPTGSESTAGVLELVQAKRPDIVVYDVVQPFAESVEAFLAFRKAAEAKGRRFVLTTTDCGAAEAKGLRGTVRLSDADDVEKVADAVRAALTDLEADSNDA